MTTSLEAYLRGYMQKSADSMNDILGRNEPSFNRQPNGPSFNAPLGVPYTSSIKAPEPIVAPAIEPVDLGEMTTKAKPTGGSAVVEGIRKALGPTATKLDDTNPMNTYSRPIEPKTHAEITGRPDDGEGTRLRFTGEVPRTGNENQGY